jgi:plastocyanin
MTTRYVFLRAACAATLLLAACGGGGGGYGGSSSPTAPSASSSGDGGSSSAATGAMTITVTGDNGALSFSPNPASAGGQLVVFRNADTQTHRVVLNDGSVDTGDISAGATSRAVQMPSAGTNYHCSLHPGMIGAVKSSTGADAPACTGLYCDDPNYVK